MRGRVNLLQHADRNMRVDLSGVEPHVAQDRLNEANVRAAFERQCRHSMAEDVTRPAFADPSGLDISASQQTKVVRCERDAVRGKN